jgi:tRNA(adenine34) deaminase
MEERDEEWMRVALEEARAAAAEGEVPIGAVLVNGGELLARGHNRTIGDCDPTAHAEMLVLREGARLLKNYRLAGVTLYVTVEPCAMCAGAMVQARVARLVYGCAEPKGGAVASCFTIFEHPMVNHRVEVSAGVLGEECAAVMQQFFQARR